jgi:hypothetical protein
MAAINYPEEDEATLEDVAEQRVIEYVSRPLPDD